MATPPGDHPALAFSRNDVQGGTMVQEKDLGDPVQGPIKVGGVAARGEPSMQEFVVDIRGATKELTEEADRYARQVVGNSNAIEAKRKRAELRYRRLGELMSQNHAPPAWGQPYSMQAAPPPPANWGPQPAPAPGYPQYGPYPGPIGQYPQPMPNYQPPPLPPPPAARPQGPPPPAMPQPPQISAPSHLVTFYFPGVGPISTYFHKVDNQRGCVFLVWDRRYQPQPAFSPDRLEAPVQARIAGYEHDFILEPTGIAYEFMDYTIFILMHTDTVQGE